MTTVAILLVVLSLIVGTVVGLILGFVLVAYGEYRKIIKDGEEDDGNDQF